MKQKRNQGIDTIYNCSKTIKYLEINLIKEVKDPHAENYLKLMKEIEEDTKKWEKNIPCSWIGVKILLKCQYYPKQSTFSMQSQIQ